VVWLKTTVKSTVCKFGTQSSSNLGVWLCDSCSRRMHSSSIRLYAHQWAHPWQSTSRINSSPWWTI